MKICACGHLFHVGSQKKLLHTRVIQPYSKSKSKLRFFAKNFGTKLNFHSNQCFNVANNLLREPCSIYSNALRMSISTATAVNKQDHIAPNIKNNRAN